MLRAPRIKAFTSEHNANEVQNNTTVNVSYASVMDPIPKVSSYHEREIKIETNSKTERVLKLMLDAYRDNPLHVNDYIVLQDKKLAELVKELTEADEVQLQISADIACCGSASNIIYLDGIAVKKNDKLTDFKIGYNEEYTFLNSYRISSDFILNTNDGSARSTA